MRIGFTDLLYEAEKKSCMEGSKSHTGFTALYG